MPPYLVQQRIHSYRLSPSYFTSDQVTELKEYAKQYGIPFDDSPQALEARHTTSRAFKTSNAFSQFTSGFTEGVLGPLSLGGWAEDPSNETQALAHSAGHLLGFALPMAGAILSFGGTAAARVGLSTVGRGLTATGTALRTGAKVGVGKYQVPLKSIPLAAGDYVADKTRNLIAKSGWEAAKYLGKATGKGKALDIGLQAEHLAIASTVSGLFNGEDDEMNNFLFGAVAGGWFGGLGNFVNIGKMVGHKNPNIAKTGRDKLWKYSDQLVKGLAGSAFQGGMASLQGAPTATQIYEYLLGGWFGWNATGVVHREANKYFNSFNEKAEDGKPVYTFEDQRTMLHGDRFEKLPEESQDLVREAFTNHIGEMYKDSTQVVSDTGDISESALVMAHKIKPAFEEAKDRVADTYRKKVKDLKPHEIAEAQAEVLEIVPKQHLAEVGSSMIVDRLAKAIVTGEELPSESRKMIEGLTETEIEAVKTGDIDPLERAITEYFEKRPHEEVITTAQDIIKAENRLDPDQPEVSSTPILKRFLNQVQEATKDTSHNPDEVLGSIIEFYNTMAPKNQSVEKLVDDFTVAITNRFPEIHITPEMKGGLYQTFTRLSQSELKPMISYNATTKETGAIWGFNWLRKKKVSSEPPSADEVINREKGLWSDKITVREFGEGVKSEKGVYYEFKPWDKKLDVHAGKYVPEMMKSDWLGVMKWLWTAKGDKTKPVGEFYLKIPKKDGGVVRIYKFHKDTFTSSTSDLISEISKNANIPEALIKKFLTKGKQVWLETMGFDPLVDFNDLFLTQVFESSFKSNYLHEKNYDFKSAVARVKRESLFASRGAFMQSPEGFEDIAPDGKVKVYLMEAEKNLIGDIKKGIKKFLNVDGKEPETFLTVNDKGDVVEMPWESKVDGWVVMHSELMNRFIEKNGFAGMQASHLKPSVAVEIDGKLFLVKGGIHPSRSAYDTALKDPNSMIIVTSAAKAIPEGSRIYNGRAKKDGTFEIVGNKGPSLEMKVKDFRINFGVYGDRHSSKPVTIKKQMHSFFDRMTMSQKGYTGFMDAVHHKTMYGTDVANEYIKELETNTSATKPKDFNIRDIADSDFVKIINDPTHILHKELNLEIFKKIKEMEADEEFYDSEYVNELQDYANSYEKWYKSTGYNPLASIINMDLYQKVVHNYRLKRFTHPDWDYSGSGWVAGVDPIMEMATGGIKKNSKYQFLQDGKLVNKKVGHFMMGHDHKNMTIDWIGGKTTKLEKAWDEFQDAQADPKVTDEVLGQMRQKLMFAVMRVPANAISGTRALLFDGFVDNDVNINDWGIYMRGRDHFYIDGADVDGDKTFFYQGLPKDYMNDLIKNDSFLETTYKGKKVFFENKAKKFDQLFGSHLDTKLVNGISEEMYVNQNPISQWDPGALMKAGQSSYFGKRAMGTVVNTKSLLNTMLSDIIFNKKGKLDIKVYSKKGKELGRLTGTTTEDFLKGPEGYYVVGVEATSRTADSANYYRMAGPQEITEILFNSAFKNLKFTPLKAGSPIDSPKFWMLKNSMEYGSITELNNKLFGYNFDYNQKWSLNQVQDVLKKHRTPPDFMDSVSDIAAKMAANEINTNPLGYFNYKNFRDSIRLLSENLFKNPDVLRYIARKGLIVQPNYIHVDYDRVHKTMEKHPEYRTVKGARITDGKKAMADFIWEASAPPDSETGLTLIEARYPDIGKSIQKTFNAIYSNFRQGESKSGVDKPITRVKASVERDYRINDSYDIFSGLRLVDKGARLEKVMENAGLEVKTKRGNVPWDDINKVAVKIMGGADIKDLSQKESMIAKVWSEKVQDIVDGKIPSEKPENDFIIFRDYIAKAAETVKVAFRMTYNKELGEPILKSMEAADQRVLRDIAEISETAKEYGISSEVAVDYYFSHLLSSLKPQAFKIESVRRTLENQKATAEKNGKLESVAYYEQRLQNLKDYYNTTTIPRFVWSLTSIPDRFMTEWMKGYADTFDLLNNTVPEKFKNIEPEFFFRESTDVKPGDIQDKVEAFESNRKDIDRLFDKDFSVTELDPDYVTIPPDVKLKSLPSILSSLKELPEGAVLRFEDLYTLMKVDQGWTGTTSIKNATWDDIRNFDRFLKEIVNGSATDSVYKKLFAYWFPSTVGERMSGHDLNTLYRMQIPFKNVDGSMGLTHIKVPVSTMTYLQKSGNALRQVEDSVKNTAVEDLFNSITVKGEVEALEDGMNSFSDLFELAIKKMNFDRSGPEQLAFYGKEWGDSQDLYNRYRDRIFKVTRGGKSVEKTGDELMTDIVDQMSDYFGKGLYEKWVGAGLINEDGEWEKIDWSRIDSSLEYTNGGLVIHDLVRYNKWGRFDIENFQKKVTDEGAREGSRPFRVLVGRRDNPLSVELVNRIQYEIALEEIINAKKINPNSKEAMAFRNEFREPNIPGEEAINNKNAWVGIGRIGEKDTAGRFVTEYFPQMMHDKKKLRVWIKNEQVQLKKALTQFFTDLAKDGKADLTKYNIKNKYKPDEFEIRSAMGLVPDAKRKTREQTIKEKLALQLKDFENFTGSRVEDGDLHSEWGINWLNKRFREKSDWVDLQFGSRPGTGSMRSETPMPHFSYSFDVIEAYTNQWIGSFFKNMNSMIGRKLINNYEKNNPLPSDVKEPWILHMRKFAHKLMKRPMVIPRELVGLSKIEVMELETYISKNNKSDDDDVKKHISNFREALKKDHSLKKGFGVNTLEYRLSDQNIMQWLDKKSQTWFGTEKVPKLPFYGELPQTEEARQQVLFQILNNIGRVEAKWSLISLLAHPKTALGNVMGGSQNTITNTGLRNFRKSWDTKWLLANVFKGAKLTDGTPITDKTTIRRFVAEQGALESFYVTEAQMDKRFSLDQLTPFFNDVFKKFRSDPNMSDKTLTELSRKHKLPDKIVQAGGLFMRNSERKLRADAFMAHYLHARETLGQIIPDLAFDNPYLIQMAIKGVEATQFLYHNVNRPEAVSSSLGKIFTRFQPFAWNSIRFRKHTFQMAARYGFNDPQSMDRVKRMLVQDMTVVALANIFVSSIFDSTLPPPMSYLQDTADWLFGDVKERERAFFSAYPHPALAPLQTVTGPIWRTVIPPLTAMINGDWDAYTSYYVHTLFPFGRLARSAYKSAERPEMVAELMFGIPLHKIGKMIRED